MAGVLTAVRARDLKKDLPALIDKVRSDGTHRVTCRQWGIAGMIQA
jgi:hypothetical protein